MMNLKIYIDWYEPIGAVRKEIFGGFVEHMGRCIYGGLYEPSHPTADKHGFRGDVEELVKELGVTLVRYPGGNFVSGYNWRDGIGKNRTPKMEYAWREIEPNTVGTDEFLQYAERVGLEPVMCVNLGTGTPSEAAALLEYVNGTTAGNASLRMENGRKKPYNIRRWCLGNEMDGPWQIGHVTAKEYARRALDTAKFFRLFDKDLKLTACGSSNTEIETYPSWDREVLEELYDWIDAISVHSYYYTSDTDGHVEEYLKSGLKFDENIRTIIAVCDVVKAQKRSQKTMYLSVDEWNVWRHYDSEDSKDVWTVGPERLESSYTLVDAVVFTDMLCTLFNHCDRVESACLAQLVNVIAPILTQNNGGVLRQTIFYPFSYIRKNCKGDVLKSYILGADQMLGSLVTLDKDGFGVEVLVNRSMTASYSVELQGEVLEDFELYDDDLLARNTFENPMHVTLQEKEKEHEQQLQIIRKINCLIDRAAQRNEMLIQNVNSPMNIIDRATKLTFLAEYGG